jgi:hypothetical protein
MNSSIRQRSRFRGNEEHEDRLTVSRPVML